MSARFGVSRKSAARLWKQYCTRGHLRPKHVGRYRISRLAGRGATLKRWIAREPDLTLAKLSVRLVEELNVRIGPTALWQQLDPLGLS